MANDIKLKIDQEIGSGNFELDNGDLIRDSGLETAVLISLFTDRRASIYDELDDENDKRGWWGDQVSDVLNDEIGSKLWLLERAKLTDETIELAKQYVLEALEWMVEDEVVASVEVDIKRNSNIVRGALEMELRLFKFDGAIEVFKFDDLWQSQLGVYNAF